MRGDFTRNTFDRAKHFHRVLMQQGRVQVDADLNEAGAIQQHLLQSLAKDLIGPHGGSANGTGENLGFGVLDVGTLTPEETKRLEDAQVLPLSPGDFLIGKGHYYVDGILCENEEYCSFLHQPDLPGQPELDSNGAYLVYLDVWERHITALEDDYIREKALNGPDTASRSKVVWQVKAADRLSEDERLTNDATCESVKERWSEWIKSWRFENRGLLKAATGDASGPHLENPCITPPESRYRGAENQLYRVEIHTGGTVGDATFKWSRDNGSMTFPVINRAGGDVTLAYLGRDSRQSLEPGQWVELVDDNLVLRGEVRPLGKVKAVDHERMVVTVDWPEDPNLPDYDSEQEYKSKHVLLRRWDHTDRESVPGQPIFDWITGALFISESDDPDMDNWLPLENGIQISFAKSADEDHYYQSGDYWLIPARTATGDVEWPWQRDPSGELIVVNHRPIPEKRPPHGVEHHYAPLAVITAVDGGGQEVDDCRRKFISAINPDTDLQVHNLDVSGRIILNSAAELLQGSLTFFSESADVEYDGGSDGLFIFQDNGGKTAFRGGKVGIGSTNPRNPLAIRAQGPSDELISFEAPDGTTKWHINQNFSNTPGLNFVESGAQGGDGRLFIKDGGFVGVGTVTPSVKLDIAGDLKVQGNAYQPGGGGWTDPSDERLKKNVKSLKGALDALLQLRGVNFEWKQPENHGNLTGTQLGMVAQDVEKVFPAWVGTSPDGMKNITFRGFEALTVEALRELSAKMDALMQRVDAIEQQMKALSTSAHSAEQDPSEAEAASKNDSATAPKSTGKRSKK